MRWQGEACKILGYCSRICTDPLCSGIAHDDDQCDESFCDHLRLATCSRRAATARQFAPLHPAGPTQPGTSVLCMDRSVKWLFALQTFPELKCHKLSEYRQQPACSCDWVASLVSVRSMVAPLSATCLFAASKAVMDVGSSTGDCIVRPLLAIASGLYYLAQRCLRLILWLRLSPGCHPLQPATRRRFKVAWLA